jgi:hypothetical protein
METPSSTDFLSNKKNTSKKDAAQEKSENTLSFSFDISLIEKKINEFIDKANKETTLESLYPTSRGPCLVSYFNKEKGFGFLKHDSLKDRIFFHISNYIFKNKKNLKDIPIEKETIISLITTRKEKGLTSEKWCFSDEINSIIEEQIKQQNASQIEEVFRQEILAQINPQTLGDGIFTFTLEKPYHLEKRIKIKPVIHEEKNNFTIRYEIDSGKEEKLETPPIQLPEGIKVTKDGLLADSIDALKKLEEIYTPIKSGLIFLEKNISLPKEIKKEKNSGYPLSIKNFYNLLIKDDQTIIETDKFLSAILSENYSGSHIGFKNSKLQNEAEMYVSFSTLSLTETERDDLSGGKITTKQITLPYLKKPEKIDEEALAILLSKLQTDEFRSNIEKGVTNFIRKNYSQIVTTVEKKIFTGGFDFEMKTFIPMSSPPIKKTEDGEKIAFIDEKKVEEIWKNINDEMKDLQEQEVKDYNIRILSMIDNQQKETRKFYAENPSEIIDNRYIVYQKEKNNKTYSNKFGYYSGSVAKTLVYFDLKTGSILYQEEEEKEYGEMKNRYTISSGDGWRRGMVINATRPGWWGTETYIVCDKKFKSEIYEDIYEKQKYIILKNMEILKKGGQPDEEFITIIQETEKRREQEKKIFKAYLGKSFEDIDLHFEEYLMRAKQALQKNKKSA